MDDRDQRILVSGRQYRSFGVQTILVGGIGALSEEVTTIQRELGRREN
ncbi:MAG: hypothetical protein ACI9G1_002130 [Pirellulaceae bacterium]|jgi:hypothetical protein